MKVYLDGQYLGDYRIMPSVNNNSYALDNRTATASLPDQAIPLNELAETILIRTNNVNIRLGDIVDALSGNASGHGQDMNPTNNSLQSKLIESGYNLNNIESKLDTIEQLLGISRKVEMSAGKTGR